MTWKVEPETVKQNGWVVGGAGNVAAADCSIPLSDGEGEVDQTAFPEFLEDPSVSVLQAGSLRH